MLNSSDPKRTSDESGQALADESVYQEYHALRRPKSKLNFES
jgi:hypothetical protein